MLNVITSTATILNPEVTQSVHNVLLNVLELAVLGLTGLASWGIRTWLASMNSSWKRAIAERLVKFAQQRITGNEEKMAYVAEKLHDHFPRLSKEEIEHLLEEAVANLKLAA